MDKTIETHIKQARTYFTDEKSIALFDAYAGRLSHYQTLWEMHYNPSLAQITPNLKVDFEDTKKIQKPRKFFMYGGGVRCAEILGSVSCMGAIKYGFRDFEKFEAIIDNGLSLKEKHGLPVLSYDNFKKAYSNSESIICISLYDPKKANAVRETLFKDGYARFIHRECVATKRAQYFDFFHKNNLFVPDEIFIHLGAADGYNQKCFADYTNGKYKKIIAFEPHPDEYAECKKTLAGLHDCHVVQAGCGDCSGYLNLSNPADAQSAKISDNGIKIKIYSLDDYCAQYCKDEKVTFIAMDVEGYELKALQGAAGLITAHKPKLGISIYHKPADIYEIPLYIKQLRPDYQLSLRLYGNNWMDDGIVYAY